MHIISFKSGENKHNLMTVVLSYRRIIFAQWKWIIEIVYQKRIEGDVAFDNIWYFLKLSINSPQQLGIVRILSMPLNKLMIPMVLAMPTFVDLMHIFEIGCHHIMLKKSAYSSTERCFYPGFLWSLLKS